MTDCHARLPEKMMYLLTGKTTSTFYNYGAASVNMVLTQLT